MASVKTLKDFTVIFDAYAKMEESVLNDAMERLAALEEAKETEEQDDGFDAVDVDLRLARFERLMKRRPFLVNDVMIRQSPHNVENWKNRVQLHIDNNDDEKAIATFSRACKSISPMRAVGNYANFWVEFANFYEERDQLEDARSVLKQAVKVEFPKVDNLAHIWCQWAEMEIRHANFKQALVIVGNATSPLTSNLDILYSDESKKPQQRLFKSVKLWSFYVDLEESVGSVESTKAVYDRILELKIATPQIITNYASFLEENNYFEEV